MDLALLHGDRFGGCKLATIADKDHGDGKNQADGRYRRERCQEIAVGDAGKTSDHHVLRIPRDGSDTADVGCHRHRQQVRHGIPAQRPGDFDHQRRQHQAHGVVDKKGREDARDRHNRDQQQQWTVGVLHHALRDQRKEAGELQVGDHDHHPEQQDDGVEIDRSIGFIQR